MLRIPDWHELILLIPAVILALSFHEFAHGKMAFWLGDPTAQRAGRLTLNPLKHLDPIGTLLLLFAGFGWAKPVPINPLYFRTRNKNMGTLWVSLAGPGMNLIFALFAAILRALVLKLALLYGASWSDFAVNISLNLYDFLEYLCVINVVLAIFNLLPIPPLDGSKVLAAFLPWRLAAQYYQFERYGFLILMLFIFTGLFSKLISPAILFVSNSFVSFAGWIIF